MAVGRDVELIVADAAAWRTWLTDHSGSDAAVWLVLAKKGVTEPTSLTYAQALEEAICHGWIDGQKGSRDASTFVHRFSRRRARSAWSQRNVGIAERMIAEGRMCPSGITEVERAKADGRWAAAYAGQASIEVPADLAMALEEVPAAAAMFGSLTSQNRYAVLYRIATAKRPDTRARRIESLVAMLARGETIHPQNDGRRASKVGEAGHQRPDR